WIVAGIGIAVKLLLPGRFDRLSIGLYLLLGWCGLFAYESVIAALQPTWQTLPVRLIESDPPTQRNPVSHPQRRLV
ncbi:hypothetical protein MKK70_00050, partial [Methylobacterium sp. E-041]|nr:hypothetical protein [Methylobacterium sp. E-041]